MVRTKVQKRLHLAAIGPKDIHNQEEKYQYDITYDSEGNVSQNVIIILIQLSPALTLLSARHSAIGPHVSYVYISTHFQPAARRIRQSLQFYTSTKS